MATPSEGAEEQQKLSFLYSVIRQQKDAGNSLSRTAAQKLVFIAQERFGANAYYSFRLYNYGPYSEQLSNDLETLEINGLAKSTIYPWSKGYGYEITPTEQGNRGNELLAKLPTPDRTALEKAINEFGDLNAKQLELWATWVYMEQMLSKAGEATPDQIAEAVHAIKPYFSVEEIRAEIASRTP